jgi:DNA polymerase-3 subunit alpha
MFTHLHVHSEYSLLDGLTRIGDLARTAASLGQTAVALTDHGALYGAIDFYKACREAGVKPIIGVEGYVAPDSRFSRDPREKSPFHLTVLAQNYAGYRNLLQLVSKAHLEGYYYKPRFDRDLLERHNEGLLVLSGCPSAEVHRALQEGRSEDALQAARWYKEVFEGRYFIELQEHGDQQFSRINPLLVDLADKIELPVVATNDSHYTSAADSELHDILLCIGTNSVVTDENRMKMEGGSYYVKSEEEMAALFPELPQAITNTEIAAGLCEDWSLEFGRLLLPEPTVPDDGDPDAYLEQLCWEGLRRRYGDVPTEVEERLRYELDVVRQTGFIDYIHVVKEISDYAQRAAIPMGVRGSAAASIILYALNVTHIDPVARGLAFERFLNIERKAAPDVDFDFADDRRDEIIQYAVQRYGRDRVAQIITFGTMQARAALRDTGRALGMSFGDTDKVVRTVPMVPASVHMDLTKALEESQELKAAYETDPQVQRLVDVARGLEGVARHASTHAAGVVISRDALIDHVPLQRPPRGTDDDNAVPTTQYAMDQVAEIGLLKMDFLGLSNLTILGRACDIIRATGGPSIDILDLPEGDAKTYEMLGAGETFGVFQLEGQGMRRYVAELKPQSVADLAAMVALYRPGPMQHIPRYIAGAHGEIPIEYPHPDLAEVLDETHGVIVYQDQVLMIARRFAGYSLGQADIMRRAMGKKKKEVMEAERDRFVAGAVAQGYGEADAVRIFDLIEPFAGYAFNKAHAWCYGTISYQTAYLKANYPAQYLCAVLQLAGESERVAAAAAECARLGIPVLPPDINKSSLAFAVEPADEHAQSSVLSPQSSLAIRFGLASVKNIGEGAVEALIAERDKAGEFSSIEDFCSRVDVRVVNKRVLESLVKAGVFDSFGHSRGALLGSVERIAARAAEHQRRRESGQIGMFDLFGGDASTGPVDPIHIPPVELSHSELLAWEKELLGVYVSDHPFKRAAGDLTGYTTAVISDIDAEMNGQEVVIAGMVTFVRRLLTRDGRSFAAIEVEDLSGSKEVTAWSEQFEATPDLWQEGRILLLLVQVRQRDERLTLAVRKAALYEADSSVPLSGFSAEEWATPERRRPALESGEGQPDPAGGAAPLSLQGPPPPSGAGYQSRNGNGNGYANGNGNGNGKSRAQPPKESFEEVPRFVVELYETQDELADRARLGAILNCLAEHPGDHTCRLVIYGIAGEEDELELEAVAGNPGLADSIKSILGKHGTAKLDVQRRRVVAAS